MLQYILLICLLCEDADFTEYSHRSWVAAREAVIYHIFKADGGRRKNSYWIGASDLEIGRRFTYNDNAETLVDVDMELFYKNRPNNDEETPNCLVPYDGCGVDAMWTKYSTTCFKLIKEARTWDYSRLACAGFAGRLASIETRGVQMFLRHQALLSASTRNWWFGLYYDDDINEELYVDPTSDTTHTAFTDKVASTGGCIELNYEYNYFWKRVNCSDENFFICQEDIDSATGCPYGWHLSSQDDRCYIYLQGPYTGNHTNSFQLCALAGASLVNIASNVTNQFALKLIQNSCAPTCNGYAWIGNGIEGNPYENWAVNNPVADECASMNIANGVWYTRNCTEALSFVCDMPTFS